MSVDHFQRLAELLELESQAEARQILERIRRLSPGDAEQSGDCLVDLVVRDEYAGLGGRTLLTLGKRNPNEPLPWTRLPLIRQRQLRDLLGQLLARFHQAQRLKEAGHD